MKRIHKQTEQATQTLQWEIRQDSIIEKFTLAFFLLLTGLSVVNGLMSALVVQLGIPAQWTPLVAFMQFLQLHGIL
ncbi:MAG TPA: hypothetical protein EYG88_12605 [Desulfocapsa sulfexigens]|nr:hypothetical protein [Desulfocapsa sulfexigens]